MGLFGKKNLRGNEILELERNGRLDPNTLRILQILRSDGVTDSDIKNWWNLTDKEHQNIKKDDEVNIVAMARSLLDQGYSEDEVFDRKLKQILPFFEDYTSETIVSDSSPLPYEVKFRMINYFNNLSREELLKMKEESSQFPTMNAYLRFLIRQKRL